MSNLDRNRGGDISRWLERGGGGLLVGGYLGSEGLFSPMNAVWYGTLLFGGLGAGLSAIVCYAYLLHWSHTPPEGHLLPAHVVGNSLSYTLLSIFVIVVVGFNLLHNRPGLAIYGLISVGVGCLSVGASYFYARKHGPMFRRK